MNILRIASFTSDLPDDQVEDDDDIIQFGGQGVSGVIAALLRASGYNVGELEHQGERGWEFSAGSREHKVWLLVSDLGAFFTLQTEDPSFVQLRPKYRAFREELLRTLTIGLNSDGRFHDLMWFGSFGDDFGFAEPTGQTDGAQKRSATIPWS